MIYSSQNNENTNELIRTHQGLLTVLSGGNVDRLLKEFDYKWFDRTYNKNSELAEILGEFKYFESENITRAGELLLARLLLHIDVEKLKDITELSEKYELFELVAQGKNSIVVSARHKILKTSFILKIIRPGASENIEASISKLNQLDATTTIVKPIDIFRISLIDGIGNVAKVVCLVFPFISGITFDKFLETENAYLNAQLVMSFAEQIGNDLYRLEKIGAYHGDLHEANIIVSDDLTSEVRFKIIDISFDAMGSRPFEECRNNDVTNFKQHLWRLLAAQRKHIPHMSLRKYIGTVNYLKLVEIFSDHTKSFAEVMKILQGDKHHQEYISSKKSFIENNFQIPRTFRLQRYEEITDPEVAVKLLVPFEPLMEKVSDFSNVYVSGNRGSGKSTYLASLAFFPGTSEETFDFRETFGIYFPCRQGEFRTLRRKPNWEDRYSSDITITALNLKIIRRTLELICSGERSGKIKPSQNTTPIKKFVERVVIKGPMLSVEKKLQTEIENLVSTLIRAEMSFTQNLLSAKTVDTDFISSADLIEFFVSIRESYGQLENTRFHILFDDAGSPYLPVNMQLAINDLILTSNSLFCIKLSAEKLTFNFMSSEKKVLENGQDYFEHNISQMLSTGPGSGEIDPKEIEKYFRSIINVRLRYFEYKSDEITDYLGDELISYENLIRLLSMSARNAYYCGWTTIWNIADRTPRNLLEIVSEIFASANVDENTIPALIPPINQNRAIRAISEKRLNSLSQIPGVVKIGSREYSLGRNLFEVTSVLGSVLRLYLKAEKGKTRRLQTLAIERNDLTPLQEDADSILRALITFGVLDSGKLGYARDDDVKKPYFVLNKIYCPAFGLAYRRDIHLRLSRNKMEMLLRTPEVFSRQGTRRIRNETKPPLDLFTRKLSEKE